MTRQTYQAKAEDVQREWLEIDATGIPLGRLSTVIAVRLMGKHKPTYTPHVDTGDFVIVNNVDKIVLTGAKADQKLFKRFSGYPSGQTTRTYAWMLEHQPDVLLEASVRRMLPKNKLAAKMLKKMKVYKSTQSHQHQAQQPKPLTV